MLSTTPVTAYDSIAYPNQPFRQTSPDVAAAIAAWHGLTPARPSRCRMLEVACGAGGNLIPLAARYPDSTFVGIDLAGTAIAQARQDAAALGLANVEFRHQDLMEFPAEAGDPFDYIAAHGFYSWVPATVRERYLEVCSSHLAAHGVAYVSYNCYPGCHLRDIWRDLMRFHTREMTVPQERIRQARGVMQWIAASGGAGAGLAALEMERVNSVDDSVLFHDDLAEVAEPVYFRELAEAAQAHGLQFLHEVPLADGRTESLPENVRHVLDGIRAQSRLLFEHYRDFVKMRRFRQTLFCRAGEALNLDPPPDVVRQFHFATAASRQPVEGQAGAETFEHPASGASITSAHPLVKEAMTRLIDAWPSTLSYGELAGDAPADDAAEMLFKFAVSGLADIAVEPRRLPNQPGPTPEVWRVTRYQAARGYPIANQLHHSLPDASPELARALASIDGTRTLAELTALLGPETPARLQGFAKLAVLVQ